MSAGDRVVVVHQQRRRAGGRRSRSRRRAGVDGRRRSSTRGRSAAATLARRARRCAACDAGRASPRSRAARAALKSRSRDGGRGRGAEEIAGRRGSPCRAAGSRRSHLTGRICGGKPVWDATAHVRPSSPPRARPARRWSRAGAAAATSRLADCLARARAARGGGGRATSGFGADERPACPTLTMSRWRRAALARAGARQGLRRLPERRDGQRRRRWPRRRASSRSSTCKRYTTLGMATDQGKISNVNGLALLAAATGRTIPQVGHDDLPAALHAGRDRRARRASSRRGLPADPADRRRTTGRAARGATVRRGRAVVAAAVVSAPGENDWLRARRPRGAGGARRRRASATSRRSARSTSRGRTPPRSSTASTSTPSRRCRSARRATA